MSASHKYIFNKKYLSLEIHVVLFYNIIIILQWGKEKKFCKVKIKNKETFYQTMQLQYVVHVAIIVTGAQLNWQSRCH